MAEDTPPESTGSKILQIVTQIMSARGFILGVAAIITAGASWFKPTDTTATKLAYDVLAAKVSELTKATEDNRDDLVAMRSYLEGYTKGVTQGTPTASVESKSADAPPSLLTYDQDSAPKDLEIESRIQSQVFQEPVVKKQASQVQLPVSAPRAPSAPLPSFDEVVREKVMKR
jgi:hypothetical protein